MPHHTRFDILRHGEPEGEDCFRGSGVDHPLTASGWQQMQAAIAQGTQWDLIISSPLSRCLEFAKKTAAKMSIELIIDDQLKEIGFGVWEGRTKEEIQLHDTEAYKRFRLNPVENRPDGAEPLEKFSNRIWHKLEQLASQHPSKRILIIAHAGVIRVVFAKTMGLTLDDVYNRLKIEYAASISCSFNDKGRASLLLPSSL
ncbi:MAG: histidine phosphatase family protein [Gammaproteobacteria bacterium]|nr:histidine phosphatase family protein [Gammaproteobacteria bacterium]